MVQFKQCMSHILLSLHIDSVRGSEVADPLKCRSTDMVLLPSKSEIMLRCWYGCEKNAWRVCTDKMIGSLVQDNLGCRDNKTFPVVPTFSHICPKRDTWMQWDEKLAVARNNGEGGVVLKLRQYIALPNEISSRVIVISDCSAGKLSSWCCSKALVICMS